MNPQLGRLINDIRLEALKFETEVGKKPKVVALDREKFQIFDGFIDEIGVLLGEEVQLRKIAGLTVIEDQLEGNHITIS